MTSCNFCNKRETSSYKFNELYACNQCTINKDNYADNSDDIIFIDASRKRIVINKDTELDLINLENDANKSSENDINNPINMENFKNIIGKYRDF